MWSCPRLPFRMSPPQPGPFECSFGSVHCYDLQLVPCEPGLYWRLAQMRLDFVGNDVVAVDGNQLGVQPAAKNSRPLIAVGAGQDSSAQRSVDVNGTRGDD